MKKLVKTLLVCGFASAMVATSAFGQPYVLQFDEYGSGAFIDLTGDTIPLSGAIGIDPITGGEALCYDLSGFLSLAPPLTSGDIIQNEGTDPSDLIRLYYNGSTFQAVYFYSLADDSSEPADVDVLPDPVANNVTIQEVAGVGTWNPTEAGQPGYVNFISPALTYRFISEVPEPSTLALFGLAGGLMALFWRQRSGRA